MSDDKHPHTQRHFKVPEITVITDATRQIRRVLGGNDIDPEARVHPTQPHCRLPLKLHSVRWIIISYP